jgi:Uma2 family endonuclease
VNGPPDLAIEIVSPSNSHKELFMKFNYYLEAGVREYWVVDPEEKRIQVHVYENGRYISTSYRENACISVTVLPGLNIDLQTLWAGL